MSELNDRIKIITELGNEIVKELEVIFAYYDQQLTAIIDKNGFKIVKPVEEESPEINPKKILEEQLELLFKSDSFPTSANKISSMCNLVRTIKMLDDTTPIKLKLDKESMRRAFQATMRDTR